MQSSSAEAVRSELVEAIERRYYSDQAGGQMWLHDLSVYLQSLPRDDERLELLAEKHLGGAVTEYLSLKPRPIVSHLDPSVWLDHFVQWSLTRSADRPSGVEPSGKQQQNPEEG